VGERERERERERKRERERERERLGMFLALIWDCNRNQREIRTKFSWVSSKAFSGGLGWPDSFQPTWRHPALQYERTQRKNAGNENAKEGRLWECGFDFGLIKILIF
jgi:hypothetical protein